MRTKKQFATTTGLLTATALGLFWASASANAQIFTTLKSFGQLSEVTGINPQSSLVQGPDGTLYGTTVDGVGAFRGTVFKVQPDGSGFAVLKYFTNGVEGAQPLAGVILSGGILYGTTWSGGSSNYGTVFKVNTDGSGYTVLKHFTGSSGDGASPRASVTLSDGTLYGTTEGGGMYGSGTVFKINTDGTSFTVLKHFIPIPGEGFVPSGSLTVAGNVIYGATAGGGISNFYGTVFTLNTDGTGYRSIKDFNGFEDGASPLGGLLLSGNVLYGATVSGGSSNAGTIFKVNTDGTGSAVLKVFTVYDGARPSADLILLGNVLYGTTSDGGNSGYGTAFRLNIDGTGYTVLRHFTGLPGDGGKPHAGLTMIDGALYGTTEQGGTSGAGTIFKLNTDGTGFAVFKEFATGVEEANPGGRLELGNSALYGTTWTTIFRLNIDGSDYSVLKHFPAFPGDGARPSMNLTLASDVIYGTTRFGGSNFAGTLFKIKTDGSGYIVLKNFSSTDGQYPNGALILSGNALYGTTWFGGNSNLGTVFRMNTDGSGYRILKHFTGPPGEGGRPYVQGGLTLSGNVLYGTTQAGGSSNLGTVFRLNTDGTGYAELKNFAGTQTDGARPRASLLLSGDVLYGTTEEGGKYNLGTIFRVSTEGAGYTVLKHFTPSDGRYHYTRLTLLGNVLYGTTSDDGDLGFGTVFKMNTDGTDYGVIKRFVFNDGAFPGDLTVSGSTLYGTTSEGGSLGLGTVFELELFPAITLNAQILGNALVLSWSNPAFTLQAAPELRGIYTNIPGAFSPYTNTIYEPRKFFRLVSTSGMN